MTMIVGATPQMYDDQIKVVGRFAALALDKANLEDDLRVALAMISAEGAPTPYEVATLRWVMSADDDHLAAFMGVEPWWANTERSLRRAEHLGEAREHHLLHMHGELQEGREQLRQAWERA